jgi:hypothetical protein
MPLPYENATSGKTAIADIQKVLKGFGATSFGVMEDYENDSVLVQFVQHGRKVTIKASAKGYAAAWLRAHPFKGRGGVSENGHKARALAQGRIAVYSILRDWIKGQVTAVEIGMLSFEGAFLGQLMLPNGQTVLERVTEQNILQLGGK